MDERLSDKFTMGATFGRAAIQCLYCTHRVQGVQPLACPAFPGGIPDEILDNEFDHRRPHPGDHGIRFEPRPELGDDVEVLYALFDRALLDKEPMARDDVPRSRPS